MGPAASVPPRCGAFERVVLALHLDLPANSAFHTEFGSQILTPQPVIQPRTLAIFNVHEFPDEVFCGTGKSPCA